MVHRACSQAGAVQRTLTRTISHALSDAKGSVKVGKVATIVDDEHAIVCARARPHSMQTAEREQRMSLCCGLVSMTNECKRAAVQSFTYPATRL